MSNQESSEKIKRLHVKCGFLDTEHLFMLPINWLEYQEVPDVNVEISQKKYNAYCTPKYDLLRNKLIVGIPKSTVLVIIFKVFMWPLSLINAVPRIIIHLQCFEMVSKKIRDHLIKSLWKMELLRRLLILQCNPRKRKISVPREKGLELPSSAYKANTFRTRVR